MEEKLNRYKGKYIKPDPTPKKKHKKPKAVELPEVTPHFGSFNHNGKTANHQGAL